MGTEIKGISAVWKKRAKESRKGKNGKVLIIGGSREYTGAVVLAGLAALRIGVDIVTIAAPEKVAWAINAYSPDLITWKIQGDYFEKKHIKEVLELSSKHDVVLIGNGIGRKSDDFVKEFFQKVGKKTCVVDADAIKVKPQLSHAVLTPHRTEFEIFSGKKLMGNLEKDVKIVQESAGTNILLLKGPVDIIASREKYFLNHTGNPGMTKGGTGDVLAGVCAGLIAQGVEPFEAACLAAFLNGKAGDALQKEKGYSFLASDLLEKIF